MRRRLGPILHLRQPTADQWRFAVGLWVEDAALDTLRLTIDAAAAASISAPVSRGAFGGAEWIAWDVSIPRKPSEFRTSYMIAGLPQGDLAVDHVAIPGVGQAPRISFFSCNGVDDPKSWTNQPDMERLWRKMMEHHRQAPDSSGAGGAYHVLVGGGDQIYCDEIWRTGRLKSLDTWDKRKKARLNDGLRRLIEDAYAHMYERWNDSWAADLQSRVPGLYIWDDHDIFDGWGSYGDGIEDAEIARAIFETARRAFTLFQLGGVQRPDGPCLDAEGGHFLQAVRFGEALDAVLLDLRSQRTPERVMREDQWSALKDYLNARGAQGPAPAHLLVISTIPVVYLNFATAEGFLDWMPWRQDLEDDLRDQWESPAHQEERARLIMTLLDHAKSAGTRVTILSGDVHVGARGQIVSRRPEHLLGTESEAIVHQLTSSAIVFPAPGALTLAGMQVVSGKGPTPLRAASHVETELVPVHGRSLLLGENNWLTIEPDLPWSAERRRLWARWIVDDGAIKPPLPITPRQA